MLATITENTCSAVSDLFSLIKALFHKLRSEILFRENLKGDRYVEYSFAAANLYTTIEGVEMPWVLDVGSVGSVLPAMVSQLCEVVGIDIRDYVKVAKFKNFEFILSDSRFLPFVSHSFDSITAVSTIEHIGLAGRYGSPEDKSGDKKALRELIRVLKPTGKIIVTIPYGKATILKPYHRVYDSKKVQWLFNGLSIDKAFYYVKSAGGQWTRVSEEKASEVDGSGRRYALGLFVLSAL